MPPALMPVAPQVAAQSTAASATQALSASSSSMPGKSMEEDCDLAEGGAGTGHSGREGGAGTGVTKQLGAVRHAVEGGEEEESEDGGEPRVRKRSLRRRG